MVVCEVKSHKEDPNQTCINVAGSQICYPGDVGTPTCSLDVVKLVINSVLSRCNVRFVWFDFKNFYLQTPMEQSDYVRINSQISHHISLKNIISHNQSRMDGFILRFYAVAMAYRNQADSLMTSCAHVLRRRDNIRQPQHLISGSINGAPSNFS